MSLRTNIAVAVVALASLVATASAVAGGNDYALAASPQSQFVSSGESASFNWLAWTNTEAPESCEVSIQELGVSLFSGLIQPGTPVGGQFSTPVLDRNSRFTFALTCGGSLVAKRAVNVKLK